MEIGLLLEDLCTQEALSFCEFATELLVTDHQKLYRKATSSLWDCNEMNFEHNFYEHLYTFLEVVGLNSIAISLKQQVEENKEWQLYDHTDAINQFVQMLSSITTITKRTESKEVQTVESHISKAKRKQQWEEYNKRKIKKIDFNPEKIQIQDSKEEVSTNCQYIYHSLHFIDSKKTDFLYRPQTGTKQRQQSKGVL
jgi:hypothetical protein